MQSGTAALTGSSAFHGGMLLNSLYSGANPAQITAITHKDGPMMVLAGPGSGKTFVITRRLCYMIREYHISPEKILVITFTRAAASQMEERALNICEDTTGVTFGTFHSVYFSILQSALHYTSNDILTEECKLRYLKEASSGILKTDLDRMSADTLLGHISNIKNSDTSPSDYDLNDALFKKDDFLRIYNEYQILIDHDRKLDFDDMVLKCRDLFLSEPEVLHVYRKKYNYIMIDEFQDINPLQYEVIRMLAAPHNNLFIVGDDDQSIYAFRGAAPELMLRFPKDYPESGKALLGINYRSTKEIVDSSLHLVSKNRNRYRKKLSAANPGNKSISIFPCDSREDQTELICRLITEGAKHLRFGDIALLFRTNSQARRYTRAFSRAGIPFSIREKSVSIFESSIGKDIRAFLSFANGSCTRDNLLRFINKPSRYIPRRILPEGNMDLLQLSYSKELNGKASQELRRLSADLDTIQKMHPYAAINYIRKGMGYESFLVNEAREKGADPAEVIESLDIISESAKYIHSYTEWCSEIDHYEEALEKSTSDLEDGVQLMTMHCSKGLEFRVVLIPDINEGCIPQKNATTTADIEEERRVLYVAMTRAKEKLILLYLKKNIDQKILPSRFLKELK